MILPIVLYGDEILREETEEVEIGEFDDDLIGDMFETMKAANGVGLSAPQINRSISVCVVNTKDFIGDGGIRETFINPEIIYESEEKYREKESCLSIPGVVGSVERSSFVHVEYYNGNEYREKRFDGFNARVLCHEIDHLKGILFIDQLSNIRKRLIKNKLKKIKDRNIEVDYPIV